MDRSGRAAGRGDAWQRAAVRVIRFELKALLVSFLAFIIVMAAFPVTVPVAFAAEPKVVIVVGPAGGATDGYRADAEQAAQSARADGATVETIYSPDATWPRVRKALQGASIVIYMGHGNGFPSIYRKTPWPKTQNGLGLNPTAGVDDDAHQYFGEAYLARDIHLAPHAVVLLHHLCYASGNSEPGLPEGTLDTAKQRVDNFAAGWLAAGAGAVVADAFGSPSYYVHRILAGTGTIESIWRGAPTAHGHVLAFESQRTAGLTALMDPTHPSSGFYRSLVGHAKLHTDEVARGAANTSPGQAAQAPADQPAPRVEPKVASVTLDGVPTAGSLVRVTLSLDDPGSEPIARLGIGVRWIPLALDPSPLLAPPAPASVAPAASASSPPEATPTELPKPDVTAPPQARRRSTTDPSASVDGEPAPKAPPIVLVTPEAAGAVVTLSDVKASGSAISANLIAPREPGLYRLSVSVHDGDGVAFSRRTQDRIPALIVRVTGVLSALVSATDRLQVVAGATVELPVAVANTGQLAWVIKPPVTSGPDAQPDIAPGEWHSVLVGQWLRLDAPGETSEAVAARATVHPDPGDTEQLSLSFIAPVVPGDYLLVLDVVSPLYGSLTAAGGSPVVVRVAVEQPEIPQPVVEGPQADQGSPTGSGAEATSDAGKGN